MEDSDSDQDVPERVLDMVRMFLAASTRGDNVALILETRNHQLTTKYRSVEIVSGAPETASTTPATNRNKRKVNPARARRSRLRLEKFHRKKEEEKQKLQQETERKTGTGDSSSSSSKLIVQLSKEETTIVETGPHSPILQVDGQGDAALLDDVVSYTFKSEYGEEDIRSSLEELFPPFVAQLDSRVRLGRMAADHQGTGL